MRKAEIYWQNPIERDRHLIGLLYENENNYTFSYTNQDIFDSINFKGIMPFCNYTETYHSVGVFPCFANRLPDKNRKDIEEILNKYGLLKYDSFDLLIKTAGHTPLDNLEFIEPLNDDDLLICKEFWVAGVSHSEICDKTECNGFNCLIGKKLQAIPEPSNKYDDKATVLKFNGKKVGYVPKYYSKNVALYIQEKRDLNITVSETSQFNNSEYEKLKNCRECIKVKMIVKK